MKLGLLTYHSVDNFGANLQALSTVSYLRNHGHDPVVIDYFPEDLEKYYSTTPSAQREAHKSFVYSHFKLTNRCSDALDVAREIERENLDGVIIGSDAVLSFVPKLSRLYFGRNGISILKVHDVNNFPNPFWGLFKEHLPKTLPVVMMSVSAQNSPYHYAIGSEKTDIGRFLRQIQFISVRDLWTYNMIQHLSSGEIVPEITPDPVFAFNANVNNQPTKGQILEKFDLPDRYLLVSFVNNDAVSELWLGEFMKLASESGLTCVALTMPKGIMFKHPFTHQIKHPLDPLDWYSLIKYSSGYVGHNMHPIVVSLHNAVPFFCFDYYGVKYFRLASKKSSKIFHLLNRAGFSENRVSTILPLAKLPTPSHVFNKIVSFDVNKCKAFAADYYNSYSIMMSRLLNIIKNYPSTLK